MDYGESKVNISYYIHNNCHEKKKIYAKLIFNEIGLDITYFYILCNSKRKTMDTWNCLCLKNKNDNILDIHHTFKVKKMYAIGST